MYTCIDIIHTLNNRVLPGEKRTTKLNFFFDLSGNQI